MLKTAHLNNNHLMVYVAIVSMYCFSLLKVPFDDPNPNARIIKRRYEFKLNQYKLIAIVRQ